MASTSSNKMDYEQEVSEESGSGEFECDAYASNQLTVDAKQQLLSINLQTPCDDDKQLYPMPVDTKTYLGKRKSRKELFPVQGAGQTPLNLCEKAVIPSGFMASALPKLSLPQISKTSLRFAFEGKALNVYGTFDTNKETVQKFLRTDLVDESCFGTITLVVGPTFVQKFKSIIVVDVFLRIESAVVTQRSVYDGGSVNVSLIVDATTLILKAEPFKASINFIPEISIQKFLVKAGKTQYLRGTLAFVVLQVDKIEKTEGGTYEQLTIADGHSAVDRATLTFVSRQKHHYHCLVEEFNKGQIIPYVARNVGTWKSKPNTISVLDVTILMPLSGPRLKNKLLEVFNKQIMEMGYGRQVYGTLEILNFNETLAAKRCAVCKSTHVRAFPEGGFCLSCEKSVSIDEQLHLQGTITQAAGDQIAVKLFGDAVDKVLPLGQNSLESYHADIQAFRLLLSEVCAGVFLYRQSRPDNRLYTSWITSKLGFHTLFV